MAALRSGMALLARRGCARSGPSAAASMGGKRTEMRQVLRPAPPPLNHESWRRFSTGGGEPKGKAGGFRLWQWAKYRVENASQVTKARVASVYVLVAIGTPTLYMMNTVRNWQPSP